MVVIEKVVYYEQKKKRPVSLVNVFTEGKKVVGKAFFFKEGFLVSFSS